MAAEGVHWPRLLEEEEVVVFCAAANEVQALETLNVNEHRRENTNAEVGEILDDREEDRVADRGEMGGNCRG